MDATERAAVDAVLARGDDAEINETIERLAKGDDESLRLAISMLGRSGPDTWELQTLMKDRPEAIQLLIEMIEQEPGSRRGSDAAYLLGNIGYVQGSARDPRIAPTLIRAVEKCLPKPPPDIYGALLGLQECVLLSPVAEAWGVAVAALDAFEQDTEGDCLLASDPAFLILWHADRARAETEITERLGRLPSTHWLHQSLAELLERHRAE